MAPIEMLATVAAQDPDLVGALVDLVNRVYAVAEHGLWMDGADRTTAADMAGLIATGEIAVARVAEGDGRIVGCVRIHALDDQTGELGILVADPDHRGQGIGRDLIRFAEDHCRRQGRTVMQLELLMPRGWTHPTKAFLDAWYTSLGYRPVRSGSMAEAYPQLAPMLATSCDLVAYRKALA
jgi:GNAT superfamily N-acetyltransferase